MVTNKYIFDINNKKNTRYNIITVNSTIININTEPVSDTTRE